MTGRPISGQPQPPGTQLPPADGPAGFPPTGPDPGVGANPVTAATVGLATAARMLGLTPATALVLAEHEQFPCTVIKTTAGFRVPFGALVRVLRSGRSERRQNAGESRHSPERER